jgi:environmental stress-induced protein Ves
VALILRAAERRAVRWKNGGGTTCEVIVQPAGSDFESFDWRLSLAEVRTAGPFSAFTGVERHMAILTGRLELTLQGRTLMLDASSAPLSFAGELAVHAAPRGAAVTDLNLMVRRARCAGRLSSHTVSAPVCVQPVCGTTLIIALAALTLRMPDRPDCDLGALDAAVLEGGREYQVGAAAAHHAARFYRADVTPVSPA